jgi:Uma2 family endonuclease
MSVQVARFTAEQYERMIEAGVFPPDYRAELIEGEIIEMSPIGTHHSACVARLTQKLTLLLQQQFIVWVQCPVWVDDYSVPQPDVAVLKPRADFYRRSKPTPADVLLIIEVSDTTLEYDMKVKVPLYARAAIPLVWLVDLNAGAIEVYSQPANGAYQQLQVMRRGDSLTIDSLPGLVIKVDDLLG